MRQVVLSFFKQGEAIFGMGRLKFQCVGQLDHVPEIIIKEVLEKMEEENILMFRENEIHEI